MGMSPPFSSLCHSWLESPDLLPPNPTAEMPRADGSEGQIYISCDHWPSPLGKAWVSSSCSPFSGHWVLVFHPFLWPAAFVLRAHHLSGSSKQQLPISSVAPPTRIPPSQETLRPLQDQISGLGPPFSVSVFVLGCRRLSSLGDCSFQKTIAPTRHYLEFSITD